MKRLRVVSMFLFISLLLFSVNYVHANSDDQVKPEVVSVKALVGNKVEVTFNEELDRVTAEELSNYSISELYGNKPRLDVLGAELDGLGTKVILTTGQQNSAVLYGINISNIADLAGNVMDSCQKVFVGMENSKPIEPFEIVSVKSITSRTVKITFNKELIESLAEDVSNYVIKEKYGANTTVEVINAELNSAGNEVTLTTEEQKGSTLYSIETNNLKDVSGNILEENETLFVGVSSAEEFKVTLVMCTEKNQVEVTFNQEIKEQPIYNLDNYEISKPYGDNQKVEIINASLSSDAKRIILHTDELDSGCLYELNIKNIISINGNVLEPVTKAFAGR